MTDTAADRQGTTASPTRLVVLGVTGTWAFAAGTLLLALRRHSPHLNAHVLVYHDAALSPADRACFTRLGAQCQSFTAICTGWRQESLQLFSPLSLAKLHCFEHLRHYDSVLWLDADVLVQDDVTAIFDYGPLALAQEDPAFTDEGRTSRAAVNIFEPVPDFDATAPNYNSGVIVWQKSLPNAAAWGQACKAFVQAHAPALHLPDQAAFNWLLQRLRRECPQAVAELPLCFNCHPRNRESLYAPIVHAFGAYKLWNDGLTAACFPEWQRDYRRWRSMGGSGYDGVVENQAYAEGGPFYLLRGFLETMQKSEQALERMQAALQKERALRTKMEAVLRRLTPPVE